MSYVWITKMVQLHGDNPCMRLPWANLVVRSWLDEFGVQEVANVRAGANGLAAARDFQTPVARFEERECDYVVLHKFNGQLFQAQQARARLTGPLVYARAVRSLNGRPVRLVDVQCCRRCCCVAGVPPIMRAGPRPCGGSSFRSKCACCVS